jgi:formylglycine-generating enzyme required for sulfatase activity
MRGEWQGFRPVAEVKERDGENRGVRGGGVWFIARYCRSAYRFGGEPGSRLRGRGFRPVAEVKGEGKKP